MRQLWIFIKYFTILSFISLIIAIAGNLYIDKEKESDCVLKKEEARGYFRKSKTQVSIYQAQQYADLMKDCFGNDDPTYVAMLKGIDNLYKDTSLANQERRRLEMLEKEEERILDSIQLAEKERVEDSIIAQKTFLENNFLNYDEEYEFRERCEFYVKKNLTAPLTAKFRFTYKGVYKNEIIFKGTVTSKNAFGVPYENAFFVKFSREGNLIEFDM